MATFCSEIKDYSMEIGKLERQTRLDKIEIAEM